jgi:single-strand DNA-binding protein
VNETYVTLVGNIASEVRATTSREGTAIASFRLASTTRRFERGRGWGDVDTLFVTVVCWRQLAENVAASCAKGDPVVVTGRLRVRQWTADDGRTGTAVELEAQTAGHDLARGTTVVTRTPPRVADRPARSDADELAEQVSREPVDEAAAADAATVAAAPTTPAERGRSVRHGTRPRSVEPAA